MSKNKIHPEIHNVGKPSDAARGKPIPVQKPSIGPDPCVTTIRGPVPSTPKHDPDIRVSVPDPKDPRNYPSPG